MAPRFACLLEIYGWIKNENLFHLKCKTANRKVQETCKCRFIGVMCNGVLMGIFDEWFEVKALKKIGNNYVKLIDFKILKTVERELYSLPPIEGSWVWRKSKASKDKLLFVDAFSSKPHVNFQKKTENANKSCAFYNRWKTVEKFRKKLLTAVKIRQCSQNVGSVEYLN